MLVKHKVLIIDDEQSFHTMIKSALEHVEEEFFCLHAYNGKEGLALYQEHNPTMVLLDIGMPVMNGIEFLKTIKPRPEALRSIVVCSVDDEPEFINCCLDFGVRGFLKKPFNISEIMFLASLCAKEKTQKVSYLVK